MIKNFIILALITVNLMFAWSLFEAYQTEISMPQPVASQSTPGLPPEMPVQNTGAIASSPPMPVAPVVPGVPGVPAFTVGGDYQSQIDQLRAAGYDESLLRQIILATINRDHLLSSASEPDVPYWKAADRDPENKLTRQLDWETDRRQQLLGLFGDEIVDDPMFEDIFKPLNDTLSFLSSDKQIRLYELQRRDEAATQSLFSGGFTQESRDDLAAQRQNLQRQIAEILGTNDAFEYQLRESRLADRMRRGLDDFDYSEAEFRQIFSIRQENEGVEFSRFTDRDEYREQRQKSEARIRDYLGSTRYEEFARSQDPAYRSLQSIGERYGNSTAEINEVYSLARAAQDKIEEARGLNSLDREERRERIAEIREESYAEIERIAGKDTADSMRENARRLGFGRRISPGG